MTTLLGACTIAMVAVFILLGALALLIELIATAFPEQQALGDPAIAAAISTVVAAIYPGARVTRIEEET